MPAITVSGLGSGLDTSGIVSQLVDAERAATEPRLDLRNARVEAEVSAFGVIKSAMSDFQGTLGALQSARTLAPVTASSSNESAFTANASTLASSGDYRIEVSQLAQAHSLASEAFAETSTTVGQGSLTFRFGSFSNNSFTSNPDQPTATVNIGSANSSLQGIRDAVNVADIGVRATLVNDGTGQRLVFSSSATGANNSLQIDVTDDDGNNTDQSGLSQLAFNPAATAGNGKNLNETISAQDAIVTIDGLSISRSSNSVAEAIKGVTLNLNEVTSGPASLKVEVNFEEVTQRISDFVDGYNQLMGTLDELTKYDSATSTAAVLLGDPLTRGIESQLRRTISNPVTGLDGSIQSLSDLGIRTQSDGRLSLDKDTLQQALDTDLDAVTRVLGKGGNADDPLVDYISASPGTQSGRYGVNVTQIATRGSYSGADISANFPITLSASDNSFTLGVNGLPSGSINLTEGSYADGDALAAEISGRLNADSFLQSTGLSLTANFTNGHIEITSPTFGSRSSIVIRSADQAAASSLGIGTTIGSSVNGLDVEGSIGGSSANGNGRLLKGAGKAEGLTVEVLGGAVGTRGSVAYSSGVANRLGTLLDQYLGSDSLLTAQFDSLDKEKSTIAEARAKLETRLTGLEERLTRRYTTLDSVLAQLSATSDFVKSQLNPSSSNTNDSSN